MATVSPLHCNCSTTVELRLVLKTYFRFPFNCQCLPLLFLGSLSFFKLQTNAFNMIAKIIDLAQVSCLAVAMTCLFKRVRRTRMNAASLGARKTDHLRLLLPCAASGVPLLFLEKRCAFFCEFIIGLLSNCLLKGKVHVGKTNKI